MEGVVVIGDRIALLPLAAEGGEHFVQQLPAALAGKDQVAVFQLAAGLFHDLHGLVQPQLEVGFLCQQRVVRTDDGAGPGMDRHDAVVLGDLFGKGKDLVALRVAVRLVHKAEGAAERTALHRLAHMGKLAFDLLGAVGRRVIAGHAGADRALPDQRDKVDKQPSRRALLELREAAGVERVEEPSADLVAVGRVRLDAEG